MNTLRVLVVDQSQEQAERLAGVLANANHSALAAAGLEEASEALFVQKFDAVLFGSPLPSDGVAEFTAKLRQLERAQRAAGRTPILSVAAEIPDGAEWCASGAEVDGYLAQSFHPTTLCEAVRSLAVSAGSKKDGEDGRNDKAALDADGFRAQVGFDQDLLVEIIDLFVAEAPQQVIEMREALAADQLERLGRAAHTIKGSFGTLHAACARTHAQDLELAAKQRDVLRCRELLSALEYDLEVLEPLLSSLRGGSATA
jgi:CheY-like chemotaxis protein/HPt (histidine-containing phosphotransfer) domain-containing protein